MLYWRRVCNRPHIFRDSEADTMNEAQYSELAEQTFHAIEAAVEAAIDTAEAALDYENNGGILTIDCEDTDTQVIVSRQIALLQIWVAAKSGGFHCAREDGGWRCTTTGEMLTALLSRVCSEQSDAPVVLDWQL